ncbi:hypothetical protein OG949_40680 (plasmid) [Streptomyces scopuliridis]|uniref:hypothetical protein n=1 Tax=Streptomyces scopuliridis TaxID=452529 RepID=UPI002DD979B7|nr:hypothetical protein [Streptomyces scopuliridis]WSB39071.1 hypothetical protein OG949_40680 [Streptomyces scopuliridis]
MTVRTPPDATRTWRANWLRVVVRRSPGSQQTGFHLVFRRFSWSGPDPLDHQARRLEDFAGRLGDLGP